MEQPSALIRRTRRAAGITQQELARRMGTSQPAVARLEAPGANPRVLTLDRAMSALGQSLVLNAGEPSGIDETLIAAELKLPHAERLRRFEALYAFAQQAGRARARRGP